MARQVRNGRVKEVPLATVKDNLSRYLRAGRGVRLEDVEWERAYSGSPARRAPSRTKS